MPDASIDALLLNLERSRLFTPEQMTTVRAELATAADEESTTVIWRSVERGWLTAWQAQMLLAGRRAFLLGKYKLLDHIGEGGMGSVFKAEQTPLGRTVAIKLVRKAALQDREAAARFGREIHAAASLDHPNIVRALDAGSISDRHFLVMEYVEGRDLKTVVKGGRKLPVGEACEYVRQAALGLEHAHQRGMIHRDIKPSNLLLKVESSSCEPTARSLRPIGPQLDSRPTVKILDMGLARLTNPAAGAEELTETGQIMGTMDYISPEQARDSRFADSRSDIYSLGCTLFRLLTGRVPFGGKTPIEKITARLSEQSPLLRTLLPEASPELEAVLARMLAVEPADRFQTAADVAEALTPFAVMPSASASRSARTRGQVAAAEAETVAFAPDAQIDAGLNEFLKGLETADAGAAAGGWSASSEGSGGSLDGTGAQFDAMSASAQLAVGRPVSSASGSTMSMGGSTLERKIADRHREAGRRFRLILAAGTGIVAAIVGLALVWKAGESLLIVDWPAAQREGGTLEVDGRRRPLPQKGELLFPGAWMSRRQVRLSREGYEPIELTWKPGYGATRTVRPDWIPTPETRRALALAKLEEEIAAVADRLSQDGEKTGFDAVARLAARIDELRSRWPDSGEAARFAGELRSRLPSRFDLFRRDQIDPDELRVAGGGDPDKTPPELVGILGESRLRHWAGVRSVCFSPDGTLLASTSDDRSIRLWDVSTGRAVWMLFPEAPALDARFAADGRKLISSHSDGSLDVWDVGSGQVIRTINAVKGPIAAIAVHQHAAGELIAVAGEERAAVQLFRIDGELTGSLPLAEGKVGALQFSPDGRVLVLGTELGRVHFCDVAARKIVRTIEAKSRPVQSIAFDPGNRQLAVFSGQPYAPENTVELWTADGMQRLHVIAGGSTCLMAHFGPEGEWFVSSVTGGHGIALWDVRTGEVLRQFEGNTMYTACLAVSPDGKTVVTGGGFAHARIRFWDAKTGHERTPFGTSGHESHVEDVVVDRAGAQIATSSSDGTVRLWNVAEGRQSRVIQPSRHQVVFAVEFDPQEKWLASAGYDDKVSLWDPASGERLHVFEGHTHLIADLSASPNGRYLASAGADHTVKVWDVSRRALVKTFELVGSPADTRRRVAFDPSGKMLAASTGPGQVALWNTSDWSPRPVLSGPQSGINTLVFTPDGRTLIGGRLSLKLWDAATGRELEPFPGWRHGTGCVAMRPDGRQMAALHPEGGLIHLWDFEDRVLRRSLLFPHGCPHAAVYTPDGRHLVTANGNGTIYVLRLQSSRGP